MRRTVSTFEGSMFLSLPLAKALPTPLVKMKFHDATYGASGSAHMLTSTPSKYMYLVAEWAKYLD